jgi:putative ABC transport system permease protein
MFFLRIMRMAVKGLQTNLLRSLLATLGVIIGVGAVVAAVSILEGSQRDILEQFESLGADQVIVVNGQRQHGGRAVSVNSLLPEDADAIRREHEGLITATVAQFQGGGQIKYFQKNTGAAVLGTTEDYDEVNSYRVDQGRFITREDVRGNAMVTVLGYGVADKLFGSLPAIGKNVKINGKSFSVIGVMEERGTLGFIEVDNQVIVPLTTAMNRLFGARYLTMLVVRAAGADKVPEAIDAVRHTLRAEHRLKPGEEEDFQIFTQEMIKQQFGQFATIFAVVFYSIAGISMVVGGIGIMNIMTVSVTERTREIGVRIAVGARRFDILRQFLIEAAIISFLGGGLGVACGWAIANLLSSVTQVLEIYTPPAAIVVALLMAIAVGIISGIYPAIRAARLDPVEALRYE